MRLRRRIHLIHLTVLILLLLPLPENQVEGIRIVYEWSRRFFDYLSRVPLVVRFLNGEDPPTTEKLIKAQGYPSETHHVTTKDGYILEIHRIPYGVNPRRPQPLKQESRVPVILFHGNSQTSADWVVNTPVEDALGFYLADSGYDCWLANQRGNDYSIRHVSLSPTSSKFWEYSFHEIGVYDITAMIDYVTEHTNHSKVNFIGFSLSTVSFMAGLSKRPEYNDKLGVAILMAPGGIFYEGFLSGFAKIASPLASVYEVFDGLLDGIPLIPHFITNLLHRVLPVICHPKLDRIGVCLIVLRIMFGHDKGLIRKDKMPLITSVAPSPFSVRIVIHGLQLAGSRDFNEYDFGITKNKEIYGNSHPPSYNISNVRVPVFIMVGRGDFLATPRDSRILAKRLPNLVDLYFVKYRFFKHLDFCYAKGAGKLVYTKVIEVLDNYGRGGVGLIG